MATAVKEAERIRTLVHTDSKEAMRVEKGTYVGILAGTGLIAIAILRGGDPGLFLNINSALIVLGGTLATTFIAFSSRRILRMLPVILHAFKKETRRTTDYVDDVMLLASNYRTGGMKKLESREENLENRFLRSGVSMIVDGYSSREINEILDREIASMIERHHAGQKILRFMAMQAPVFGMCGTLIGLIQMLMHLDDPAKIGPYLATALITTFYGLILANLVITPLVAKLHSKTEHETLINKALRVGVLGIHDRLNPQKIRKNMNSLLPPDQQR